MSIPADEREERLPPHVYRYVERELFDYKANVILVEQHDQERADIIQGTPSQDDEVHIHSSAPGDPTYAKVARLLRLTKRAERVRPNVEVISALLAQLNDEQRKLIKAKYIERRYTNEGIAEQLGWSLRSYYRRKDEIVRLFARALGIW